MKHLILMRHAKSDRNTNLLDFERPLNERGRSDAAFIASCLKKTKYSPDNILCSSAARAKETSEIVAKVLHEKKNKPIEITETRELYLCHESAMLKEIQNFNNKSETLLVISHNPTLEEVATNLCGGDTISLEMPTSSIICFQSFADTWKELEAENTILKWFTIPKLIRAMRDE